MSGDPGDDRLRVALCGMSDRMQSAIRLFFKTHCDDLCVQSDKDSAEVSLIDLDECMNADMLAALRLSYPGRPHIVVSLKTVTIKDAVVLRKPLSPKALRETLSKLQKSVRGGEVWPMVPSGGKAKKSQGPGNVTPFPETAAARGTAASGIRVAPGGTSRVAMALSKDANTQVGTMQDISTDDSVALVKVYYDPAQFFQGMLEETVQLAKKKQHYVKLKSGIAEIVVYPDAQYLRATFRSDNACRALCSTPLGPGQVSRDVLPKDYHPAGKRNAQVITTESLFWDTALFSARGRVPAGTSMTAPIYLRSWPNMTRLTKFPHAMRIAALWASHPYSLPDTATVLRVPQRYVFAFYSAASALGHAGVTRRAVDMLFESPNVKSNQKRGLFGRILAKLSKNLSAGAEDE